MLQPNRLVKWDRLTDNRLVQRDRNVVRLVQGVKLRTQGKLKDLRFLHIVCIRSLSRVTVGVGCDPFSPFRHA